MSKKPTKRMNLKGLLERLEEMKAELGDEKDKKKEEEEVLDEFTRLKKMSGKQIAEIRRTIAERDELVSSSSGRI
jgi:hypothetical protein